MTGPDPAIFKVLSTEEVSRSLRRLKTRDRAKFDKVGRARSRLAADPSHPGLRTHLWKGVGSRIDGRPVFTSYVENHAPGAWRMWWYYGPDDGQITLLQVGPHL